MKKDFASAVAALKATKDVDPVTLIDVVPSDDLEAAISILTAIDSATRDRDWAIKVEAYRVAKVKKLAELDAKWRKRHPEEVTALAELMACAAKFERMEIKTMKARPEPPFDRYGPHPLTGAFGARRSAIAGFSSCDEIEEEFWREKEDLALDARDKCSAAHQAAVERWEREHPEIVAAEEAAEAVRNAEADRIWRRDCPEEAAEYDREQAEHAAQVKAETEKRIKIEKRYGKEKTFVKARKEYITDAMASDRDAAKEDARESGERWGDIKDEWEEAWLSENWGKEQEAEFEREFEERWKRDHG